MSTTMKGFRCWGSEAVKQTVYTDIGMLPTGADAVFLGAHTPMDLVHQRGVELPDEGSGERQVLAALLAGIGDQDRNTLVAVIGKAGSGKSHVVRWVHAHLDPDDSRYHLLYVPRAVQTIRELLRRIIDGLPGAGGQELLDRIDTAVSTQSPAELRDRVLEEMRLALTWIIDNQAPVDGETPDERDDRLEWNELLGERDDGGKRRNGLADLLSLDPVNRKLLRPGGHLENVVRSALDRTTRRDDDQEGFSPDDLPLREPGIRRALVGNNDLRELWNLVGNKPDTALDLLQRALKIAVPRTLGLRSDSGETLDLLFRTARRALRDEGRELMLVFEDLAQFGLIDGELYDQFITQPGTGLAPVRALFAVTDGPFGRLPVSVQERITHRFRVDSSALRDRDAFVARYLNLVRVGRDSVEAAWQEAKDAGTTEHWMSNACDSREDGLPCRVRDECHSGFGTVDIAGLGQVSLYPYNEVALRRALSGQGTEATPRMILNECVADALSEAYTHIGRGDYPHARVEERSDFTVRLGREVVLEGQPAGPSADRLYRALVLWGDERPLPQPVLDAFALPAPTARGGGRPEVPVPRPATTPAGNGRELRPSPLDSLFQWQNGTALPDGDTNRYRDILHKLVLARLDLDQDLLHVQSGIGQIVLNGFFTMRSFRLAGLRGDRGGGQLSDQFAISPTPKDIRVLIGAQWFFDHRHWRQDDGTWAWPTGYDPVDLMLTLETRLDAWAEEVRQAFRRKIRDGDLAGAAVGTRAVALLATGVHPDHLQTVDAVLGGSVAPAGPSTPSWRPTDLRAHQVIGSLPAADMVRDLAAVRQGESRRAQLVDAVRLESSLHRFLESPSASLRQAVKDYADVAPVLGECAAQLLAAITEQAPGLLDEVAGAVDLLSSGLEGQSAGTVARDAREVGRRAVVNQLFRPDDGWNDFADAVGVLESIPADLPLSWDKPAPEDMPDEALAEQHRARLVVPAAAALEQVQRAMAATLQASQRGSGAGGGLEGHQLAVRTRLATAQRHVQALSAAETADE